MLSENYLTACIACSDPDPEVRVFKLVKLLLKTNKFSEIYLISSSDKPAKLFTLKDINEDSLSDGSSIFKDEFPENVTIALVHSSDTKELWKVLWTGTEQKADFVFKFTTSGDPDIETDELPICRENEEDDLGITASDIEELVAYIIKERKDLPSMCFPSLLNKKQEILTLKQRHNVLKRLFKFLGDVSSENKHNYYEKIYKIVGYPKPIIYIFDDYNNYIVCHEGLYIPNPNITEDIAQYYCGYEGSLKKFTGEILSWFCLMLNNLSLTFTIKAPPLWIPNTQAGYDLISSALPLEQIARERSQIAGFIVDLEWLPTITNYCLEIPSNDQKRQQWRKMGRLAIDILSQLYPEIPSFIFTGLQPAQELQDGLSRGAFWGFQKEETHHYSRKQETERSLTEQLTYINLERHLARAVDVRYGAFQEQEVPFPKQLKLDPSSQETQKLIKQLQLEQPIGKGSQSQALQKLIAGLFPAASLVEPVKVLTTGKSKAQATFFVSPTSQQDKLATRFIKIGPWLSIQKEYQAYQTTIHPRLNSHIASLIHKPVLVNSQSNEMPKGALMYSLAGFPEDYQNLRSLNELFEQQMEKPGGDVLLCERLQNTLEKVLLPLYQPNASKPDKKPLWRWLGDVLPPLYTGVLIPLPLTSLEALDETKAPIVIASKTAQGYKNTAAWTLASFNLIELNSELEKQKQDCQQIGVLEQPSHWDDKILAKPYKQVLLSGWQLSAVEWQEGNLGDGSITLVHPDLGMRILLRGRSEDIRLRFGATWLRPGMLVKVLACLDTNNQELERIKRKINENLSNLNWLSNADNNPASDVFGYILNGFKERSGLKNQQLISPFQVFNTDSILPSHYTISARAGAIHGDLNLNNILYPANETVGWLIDFELVKERGTIAFDLAKLEVEIWNHHLSPYLGLIASLSDSDRIFSSYQLLYWCLQALDFPGNENEFFMTKLRITKGFPLSSDTLLIPVNNALKALKAIRLFGLEKCKLASSEIKWALAAYLFNSAKFQSTSNLKEFRACSPIFAFLASAWHLNDVLPKVNIS